MRLEADDGRPETSPATTTRRSNGRSRSCARTASHPGLPLSDIGAVQDTGRSPLHLLLDDRASRDGACGLCFCKLVSTVWALLFSSVGGWFPTETAPSEPAALFFLLSGHEGVLATVGASLEIR